MNEKINILLLVFLLLWIPLLGWFGYYLSVGSDQYEVVRFAQDLARGTIFRSHPVFDLVKDRTEPGRLYSIHYGGYLLKDGKMYCKYAVGYPLILAVCLRLFGFSSVFFANFFLLSALLLLVFLVGRIHFRAAPSPSVPALGAALLLVLLCDQFWKLSVTPHGDVSSVFFALAAVYCLLRALPPGGAARPWLLLLAGVCLGFAASIRPPNLLIGFPLAVYFLRRTVGKLRFLRLSAWAALLVCGALLGLCPVFAQNYLAGGNILKFTQFHEVHLETVAGAVRAVEEKAPPVSLGRNVRDIFLQRTSGWGIGNIHAALPVMSFHILLTLGPLFTLLCLLGFAAGWKQPETKYLFLPAIITFLVFYSGWVRPLERYLIVLYPFVIIAASGGVVRLLSSPPLSRPRLAPALLLALIIAGDFVFRAASLRWGRSPSWRLDLPTVALLIPALSLLILRLHPRPRGGQIFNFALAAALLANSAPIVASRGQLFHFRQAERFRDDVKKICPPPSVLFATKFLTQTIDLFTDSLSLRPFDLDYAIPEIGEAYDLLLRHGFHLYLIDNVGKRSAGGYIPAIQDYYAVAPAGTLRGSDYNLEERFGKPVCTVYSIERWREETVRFDLPAPAPGDYLLTLNLHKIWETLPPRSSLAAFLNGTPFPHRFENGVNYLVLSAAADAPAVSSLEVRSDRGLPPDMFLDCRWAGLDYVIDLGRDAAIPDRAFLLRPERAENEEYAARTVRGTARITFPILRGGEERSIELSARIADGAAASWSVALDGVGAGRIPLRPGQDWQTAEIALPPAASAAGRSYLELSGDRPLALESVRIQSWGKTFRLPTPDEKPYLLKAGVAIPKGEEAFLELNGRRLPLTLRGETFWAMLPADALSHPLSDLRLGPERGGARMHISLLEEAGYPFRFEAGSPSGREFKGEGWYPPELHLRNKPFAWTAGTAEVYLPIVPGPDEGMEICLGYIGGRPPGVPPARVSLEIDGQALGSFAPEAGVNEAVFALPAALSRPGVRRLTIASNAWRPADYPQSRDERQLGLMIGHIECRAVAGLP